MKGLAESSLKRLRHGYWPGCVFAIGATLASAQQTSRAPVRAPDVVYIPTPRQVVAAMLQMANVGKTDIVYDLGSGDGRIVIAAVKDFGAAPTRTLAGPVSATACRFGNKIYSRPISPRRR